jgi:hypothetical protein
MFGMLDYRAGKLYMLLFGIPLFLFSWLTIVGLPFLYYGIGLYLANGRILQAVITIVAYLILGVFFAIVFHQIDKLLMFLFKIFVDVIPADNRTKEEAELIVKAGNRAVFLFNFNKKHPSEWTDNDMSYLSQGFLNFFYKDKIENRLRRLRVFYLENTEVVPSASASEQFLKEQSLNMTVLEQVITNPVYRNTTIQALFLLYLIVFNPLA